MDNRLAQWWCKLNSREIPDDLPHGEFKDENERRHFILGAFSVVNAIGLKAGLQKKWKNDFVRSTTFYNRIN